MTASTKTYDTSFAEDHALDAIAKEAKLRLQHQHEHTREAGKLRRMELEKNVQDDDGGDSPTGSNRSRPMNTDGANTNSLLLQKFLNGDIDLRSIDQRDLRRLLSELESKYKSLMIMNSSLYNDKQALIYQVELFKDTSDEHFETLNQAKRQFKEKSRDFDLQKQTLMNVQQECNQLKEILANRERLIEESGMQLYTEEDQQVSSVLPTGLISQETLILLNSLDKGSIDEKLKQILNEKHEQFEQIVKLKSELDEEKKRLKTLEKKSVHLQNQNINGISDSDQQKQLIREITELKNRLQRLEADNGSLQQENKRFDVQFTRHKQQLTEAERVEEELKQERRQLQRELRTARDDLESERTRSDVLQRENERLRTIRKNILLNSTDDNLVISRSHSPLRSTNPSDIQ